jgi:NAD(P)-dependent dehydrogenase (short-subunit alcohol dehydrogenase family)
MVVKNALVTGATSGIGFATCKALAVQGYEIIASGRDAEALIATRDELRGAGFTVSSFQADMSDENSRKNLMSSVTESHGGLDALVNCAGIIANGTIENTSISDWDAMLEINLTAVFHLMQLSTPLLEKRKGSIVNVSSVAGSRAFPNVIAYCVSKAGVDQLTRCAALDLAPKGIRVNAVNPGVVVSNLHRRGGMDEGRYQEFLEHSKTTHPLGRVGSPEEIADLISFLVSEKAGWITGVTYEIDGGRALTCAR